MDENKLKTKITRAVVLVKLEDGTVHEVIIPQLIMLNFLERYSFVNGTLPIHERALEGIDLVDHNISDLDG